MAKSLSSDEMMAAILSYLGILVLIPWLVIKKKNDFIKFHVAQGIVMFIAWIIIGIAWAIVSAILYFVPIIAGIIGLLMGILYILIFVLVIIAIIKAVQGEKWEIPVIYGFSKNFKIK